MSSDTAQKKRSWTAKFPRPGSSGGRPSSSSGHSMRSSLPTAEEGKELQAPSPSLPSSPITSSVSLPLSNAASSTSSDSPTTSKRRSFSLLTTFPQTLDNETSPNGTSTAHQSSPTLSFKSTENNHRASGSFKSFTSMMGGFPSLSLSRTNTRDNGNGNGDDKESRGRTMAQTIRGKSASQAPGEADSSRSRSRARSTSPFSFRRFRQREPSPVPEAIPLAQSDVDLSDSAPSVRPRTTAFSYDSGDETVGEETEEEDWSDDDYFDPVTERNTERNAVIAPPPPDSGFAGGEAEADVDPDPLGEGVNVVVPPEPYFPSTLNRTKKGPRRRKSTKHHEPLPYETSRPIFQRDRCTITLTQGDPEGKLGERRKRKYMVASDLSEESRYAVEWAIGTVLRDGDELLMVTVTENEAKVDPPIPNAADRTTKLRAQQERQGLAYILLRQATSLLQRTKLNVKVACQAWHAKSARRMLLDIVDYTEPTMVIVGSRGLGQLKGILLGSTSHYLIQKCSVPVMVARRRLKRPARRSAHLSTHRRHVSLAEAGIDRVAPKVDEDVQVMREEIKRDDDRRDGGPGSRDTGARMPVEWKEEDVEEADEDENDEAVDAKVAGE